MKNTYVREATVDDLPFLCELETLCFPAHRRSSRRSLKNSLQSKTQSIYLVEQRQNPRKIVPKAAATVIFHKRILRIYSIAVHPEFRKQGNGDQLMRYIEGVAALRGYDTISLEADAMQPSLVQWYTRFGFAPSEEVPDYYAPGEPALRMVRSLRDPAVDNSDVDNLVVVDNPKKWPTDFPEITVVSARDYLAGERFRSAERFHVLNLCTSYRAHTIGYYVSLLAAARNQRIVPTVMAVKDISNKAIAQSILEEIDDVVQEHLANVTGPRFDLTVMMGMTPDPAYAQLARRLFKLFELPVFEVSFHHSDGWKIRNVHALTPATVQQEHPDLFRDAIIRYFRRKRYQRVRLKKYKYDLAILVNPEEKNPPSGAVALNRFRRAGEEVGFYVEFITKMDFQRVREFDALFIRETTGIEHHTYRFARHAYTEGLVVIDDPWSILHCSNKIYLYERLSRARIRQPRSWILSRKSPLPPQLQGLVYPVVLKLPESSFSLGVYRADNLEDLSVRIAEMFKKSDIVIAQEFLRSDLDWRIGVLDDAPLFACKYYMAKNHWQIYNWASDSEEDVTGDSETLAIHQVPDHILKTAIRAAGLIGDGLYGVDLKDIGGQAYVIEVNDNPNIDAGIEDQVLQDEMYLRVMRSFFNRIERERHQPRYLL